MLEILKINRMRKLMKQYSELKNKAMDFMQNGDLQAYVETLAKASQVKNMYLQTARVHLS
ncbi:hypothetical protein BH09BAC1_BH09BAC1_03670 [soil metagenome]